MSYIWTQLVNYVGNMQCMPLLIIRDNLVHIVYCILKNNGLTPRTAQFSTAQYVLSLLSLQEKTTVYFQFIPKKFRWRHVFTLILRNPTKPLKKLCSTKEIRRVPFLHFYFHCNIICNINIKIWFERGNQANNNITNNII